MLPNLPQREEFLRKKRKKKIIKYSTIALVFVLLIGLASFISHRNSIRISQVELEGGVLVTQSEVEEKTLEYLKGSYVWLFPRDNAFWYPRKSLANYLKENFKRIDTVDLNLKNFKVLTVKITERKPAAIWCDKLELLNEGDIEHCYFMDLNSTLFAVAPQFSGDAYFRYYGLVNEENPIGLEYIASTTKFAEIHQFVELVKSLSLRPQYVVAKEADQFSMKIAGGGEIYFDTKKPLTSVFENLETLLQTPTFAKYPPTNIPVQYIDLRYGNKLFYKLRE